MARLTIRIDLGERSAFGPGKARLLETIEQEGSIRAAAAAMKMSYRRAWLLVKDIERVMGAPVIAAATGGVKGGGASLTALGRAVLANYRRIEKTAGRSVAAELRTLSRMARGQPRAGPKRRRPRAPTPVRRRPRR